MNLSTNRNKPKISVFLIIIKAGSIVAMAQSCIIRKSLLKNPVLIPDEAGFVTATELLVDELAPEVAPGLFVGEPDSVVVMQTATPLYSNIFFWKILPRA